MSINASSPRPVQRRRLLQAATGLALTHGLAFPALAQAKPFAGVKLRGAAYQHGFFNVLRKYIPEFENPQVLVSFNEKDSTFTTRPAKKDITIRNLLTHTSGISYGNATTRKIYDKMGIPVSPLYTQENKKLGDIIKILAKCPLEHDPGEKFTYGMSLDVLGYLIEVVSGKPVDQYFKEKIFEPLGMKNTCFYLPQGVENRLVTLYQKDKNTPLKPNPLQ